MKKKIQNIVKRPRAWLLTMMTATALAFMLMPFGITPTIADTGGGQPGSGENQEPPCNCISGDTVDLSPKPSVWGKPLSSDIPGLDDDGSSKVYALISELISKVGLEGEISGTNGYLHTIKKNCCPSVIPGSCWGTKDLYSERTKGEKSVTKSKQLNLLDFNAFTAAIKALIENAAELEHYAQLLGLSVGDLTEKLQSAVDMFEYAKFSGSIKRSSDWLESTASDSCAGCTDPSKCGTGLRSYSLNGTGSGKLPDILATIFGEWSFTLTGSIYAEKKGLE